MVSYKIVLSEKPKVELFLEDETADLIVNGEWLCSFDSFTQDKICRQLLESVYCLNLDEPENKKLKELLNNNQISEYYGHEETELKTFEDILNEGGYPK